MLPSWTWPLLQSALGMLNQPSLIRLSWDSFARCPSADIPVARPLPVDRNRPSASRCHTSRLFHPRGFSPPRRFAPRDSSGCFATQAGRGSLRCQSRRPSPPRRSRTRGTTWTFPAARAPFEELLPVDSRNPPLDGPVPSCGCLATGADPKVLPHRATHFRALLRRRVWPVLRVVADPQP
jgi:hypothetical protein